jgi:hypothetical protein
MTKVLFFCYLLLNKNMINWPNIRNFNNPGNEDLANSINEQKLEQKRIMEIFNEKMKVFATERSFESSLDILEEEIIKLNRIIEKHQKNQS